MSKKNILKKAGALLLALTLTVGATGCDFLVTDSEADLKQTVAKVDITATLKNDKDLSSSANGVSALIKNGALSTSISKRELVIYFMSVGQQYVDNYQYTYADTINMLLDTLTQRKIMTQYAIAYYLKNGDGLSSNACLDYIEDEIHSATGKEKTLLQNNKEVLTMKYFLTNGGKTDEDSMKDFLSAVYSLQKSLNDSLDTAETELISGSEEEHDHADARTLPNGIKTEKEDYVPLKEGRLDYGIYTGRQAASSCGDYERVEGSTATTRKNAYNTFLSNLQGYGLIGEKEDASVFTELNYYYTELSASLSQALVTKLYDTLKQSAVDNIKANNYKYVTDEYAKLVAKDKTDYKEANNFNTAINDWEDGTFITYGHENFGFVYNILLPFSTVQSNQYEGYKNKGGTKDDIFNQRKALLNEITGKDLRDSWFSEHDHANYATKNETDGKYYFFKETLENTNKYEPLTHYLGNYPFNGSVTNDVVKANPVNIDSLITIMESYINDQVGSDVASGSIQPVYEVSNLQTVYTENGVTDYSKFIYYKGKVELADTSPAQYFNPNSNAYKALAAVNELMFAYSTDTGCLNTYMGYAVSPYETTFVDEFAYAARMVVREGVGNYCVAPSDYGWHIIYCSYAFEGGEVYGALNLTDIQNEVEGSFSYMYYQSIEASVIENYTYEKENNVLKVYDASQTRFEKAYKNLLDLDKA